MSKSTKINKFDRKLVRAILAECEEALQPIAEKYSLTLDRKGSTYRQDALPVMYQFLLTVTDEDGAALDSKAQAFQKYAGMFGLKPDDLGREFRMNGKVFRITGLKPRSPKYPVLAEQVNTGKGFKFPAETVRVWLAHAAA